MPLSPVPQLQHAAGVALWSQDDPGGDVAEEPARPQQGDARPRPGAPKNGAAGEENHRGHQENGKDGADGEDKSCVLARTSLSSSTHDTAFSVVQIMMMISDRSIDNIPLYKSDGVDRKERKKEN